MGIKRKALKPFKRKKKLLEHCPVRIISGGQTGADRAGLDVGLELGVPIGGFCPKGRRSEDGRIPDRYPLLEMDTSDYAERTRHNVAEADGTLVFTGHTIGEGSRLTIRTCKNLDQPCLLINVHNDFAENVQLIREWLWLHQPGTLNVAGSRASREPDVYERTKMTLMATLRAT